MKKCIVLDLDNTLWGGVVGEDGIDGLQLSIAAPGSSFIAFQQVLLDLYHRGVILAINSANNYEDAMTVIRTHPNMILKEKYFSAYRINWQDKVENLRELAQELNIGLDSMVFLDDNPNNREAVRKFLPEVETPELPVDPALYAKFLLSLPYFAAEATTNEDAMRGNLYVTERLRKEVEKDFQDRVEFLTSLGLEISVRTNDASAIARIAQLTEKTNQFNTNKIPMSSDEVAEHMNNPERAVFHGHVTDQFGDYGITAVAFIQKSDDVWNIESYVLSCRVIGRGTEEAFLYAIAAQAKKEGASGLTIAFTETEKNIPAKNFIDAIFTDKTVPLDAVEAPAWIAIHHENF